MKLLLITASLLALLAADMPARDEALTADERETLRQLHESEPREESARLVRKSRRVIREHTGEKVVVTRRTYEDPQGARSVRETKRPLDPIQPVNER